MGDHLQATLIEVVSVIAARKQLKEPIKVPRPNIADDPREAAQRQQREQEQALGVATPKGELDSAFKQGIGVLAKTSKRVRR